MLRGAVGELGQCRPRAWRHPKRGHGTVTVYGAMQDVPVVSSARCATEAPSTNTPTFAIPPPLSLTGKLSVLRAGKRLAGSTSEPLGTLALSARAGR